MTNRNYKELAQFIIEHVGGRENVRSLTHCITRLRFVLFDEQKADDNVLEASDGIVSVIRKGGQYQVVIGNEVTDVYDAANELLALQNTAEDVPQEQSLKQKAVDIISGTFWPFLGVMCATGIIKGVIGALSYFELMDASGGTYTLLYSLSDCFFYFLPVMIAITMSAKLNMNQFTAVTLAMVLVYPTLVNITGGEPLGTLFEGNSILEMSYFFKFCGIPVIMPQSGYTSSVIPIMLALLAACRLEKQAKKMVPAAVKSFFVPVIVLVIMTVLTYLVIGPVAYVLSNLSGQILGAAFKLPLAGGALGGFIVGGCWQLFVMMGLHFGITPLAIVNLSSMGYDFVLPPNFVCCFATSAAVLAMYLKTKDQTLKSAALPAFFSGLCGVTEPAIYGITLPRIKIFIITCISSGAGGMIMGLQKVFFYMVPGTGVFGFPAFIDVNGLNPERSAMHGVIWAAVAVAVTASVSFVLTSIFFKEEPVSGSVKTGDAKISQESAADPVLSETLCAPLKGRVIALAQVKDPVFSSGTMGTGLAIEPEEGKVYAPCDGVVETMFPTGHAIGICSDNGAELLIHVGMDTVELDGRGFHPQVKTGERCQKGQILLEFDMHVIREAGYVMTTPVVVTNAEKYKEIEMTQESYCQQGEVLLRLNIGE